jgi:uncharacterized membrane protein YkvA (DUF1232 family)
MLVRLRQWVRAITLEAHALSIAARHPRTPWYAKALALAIAAYALSPIDLIPDFVPVLGLVDDILLLPLAIAGVLMLIPADVMAESRAAATAAAERPTSRIGAIVIVTVWVAAIGFIGWLVCRYLGPP